MLKWYHNYDLILLETLKNTTFFKNRVCIFNIQSDDIKLMLLSVIFINFYSFL